MISTKDIMKIVKNTITTSIKCNIYHGYIGWSSCDNICMDMHDCLDIGTETLEIYGEKYKDVMIEWVEDLEEIKNFSETKDKISAKIAEMESRLLDKMELMKTINLDESGRVI